MHSSIGELSQSWASYFHFFVCMAVKLHPNLPFKVYAIDHKLYKYQNRRSCMTMTNSVAFQKLLIIFRLEGIYIIA